MATAQHTRLLLAVLAAALASAAAQDVFATVEQGVVRGAVVTSVFGTPYASFQAIPYAQPPVGELRFQPPRPAASWEGVRDALAAAPSCVQLTMQGDAVQGSEDCLYVSVYAPLNATAAAPRPVLVWMPVGAFKYSDASGIAPDTFIQQDIVVAVPQPRTGALGLLSTGDAVIPGNAGMKDMILALQWIQTNIAAFGGDPQQVTVGGESAGGCSTSHLLLSPLAAGLFRSAIIHSGEAVSPWGVMADPAAKAFRLAEVLGFSTDDSAQLLDFLLAQNASDLVVHDDDIITPEEAVRAQHLTWMPVLEAAGEGAFLTEWPAASLKAGRFNKVPVLTGFTSGDGQELTSQKLYLSDPAAAQELSDNFVLAIAPVLHLPTEEQREQAALQLRGFYFGHENITTDDAQAIVNLVTDIYWGEPADATVRAASSHPDAGPIYYHLFDYRGSELGNATYGTGHAAQSRVVFYQARDGPLPDPDSTYGRLRDTMLRLWSNFIKLGTPSPEGEDIVWQPYDSDNRYYMHITDTLSLEQEVYKDRMDFWAENIPL